MIIHQGDFFFFITNRENLIKFKASCCCPFETVIVSNACLLWECLGVYVRVYHTDTECFHLSIMTGKNTE